MIFKCLKKAGLKLNPEKCRILCEEFEYLGHIIIHVGHNLTIILWMVLKIFLYQCTLNNLDYFLA